MLLKDKDLLRLYTIADKKLVYKKGRYPGKPIGDLNGRVSISGLPGTFGIDFVKAEYLRQLAAKTLSSKQPKAPNPSLCEVNLLLHFYHRDLTKIHHRFGHFVGNQLGDTPTPLPVSITKGVPLHLRPVYTKEEVTAEYFSQLRASRLDGIKPKFYAKTTKKCRTPQEVQEKIEWLLHAFSSFL
jgi:hypothetical protein